MIHHDAKNHLPSGGWHFTWVGEPERGTGIAQPGGWAYNLLDYLDASDLRAMGRGTSDRYDRTIAILQRCQTPLSHFICPSRRTVAAYPQLRNQHPRTRHGALPIPIMMAAKTDYAANVGDCSDVEFSWQWPGPIRLSDGDDPKFDWPDPSSFTGVIFGRSRVRLTHVLDGVARTYLFGEKYVSANHYESGEDWGDNENLYVGFNNDSCRSTLGPPQRDLPGVDYRNQFGSAHTDVWQAAMCDGSVRALSYGLNLSLHQQFGNIADGRRPARARDR